MLNLETLSARQLVESLISQDGETNQLPLWDALLIIGAAWECACGQHVISGRPCDVCLATAPEEDAHEYHSGDVATA